MTDETPRDICPAIWARRHASWSHFRFAGVRLSELVRDGARVAPWIAVNEDRQWTLYVTGKGG